jgi:PAS domain S-box-containing protein
LEESERRFRQLFDNAINGFVLSEVIYDEDGEPSDYFVTNVNRACEKILGLSKEELVGKPISKVVAYSDESPAWRALSEVAKTGVPQRVDFYSDVFERYLHISTYRPMENQIASIFSDVTDRVKAQLALQESEKKYRQLFENAINAFALHQIVLDDEGTPVDYIYLDVNEAFRVHTGIKEDVIGKSAREVIPGLEQTNLIEIYGKVALTGEPVRFETYVAPLNRHFLISAFSSEPGQFASVFSDITERVLAEEVLRKSERRYRLLFDQALYGFFLGETIFDEQGNPVDFTYLELNKAFEKIAGVDAQEVLGKKVSESTPTLLNTGIIEILGKVAETGKPMQYALTAPEHGLSLLVSSYSPIEGQVASIILDIAEQVRAEQELRLSEEKFRLLYESMTQGVIYHNAEDKITLVNPAAERILGTTASDLLGKSPLDGEIQLFKMNGERLPNEKHPAIVALRTGEKVENFDFGLLNFERNEMTWIEVSAIPQFREDEDQPYEVFTTFLEITDRVLAQRALEERIKELGCLSRVSRILQEKTTLEEICPLVVKEVVTGMRFPDLALVELEVDGQVFYSEEPFAATPYILTAPIQIRGQALGRLSVFYRENKPFLIPEEQNLLDGIAERLGLWHQQNDTQKRLAESERWFRNAILQAPNPIMIHTEDGEVVEVNDTWLKTTGYARDEIDTVEKWMALAHPDRHAEIRQIILDNFQNDAGSADGQYPVWTKNGEMLYWYFSSAPLGNLPDGRTLLITIAIDITNRVIAEEEKEQYYNRIMAMSEVDRLMVSTLELEKVLELITTHMGNVIQFDGMSVLLKDGDSLQVIACQGFKNPEEILKFRFPSKPEYPNYKVVEEHEPVMVLDIPEDYPDFLQPGNSHINGDIKAWLGVPLVNQNEVIGMFAIDRVVSTPYSETDIDIALQYANRAAIAITNAQLFEQTRENLERLEILRKIDSSITSSHSLKEALYIVLEQIRIGLGVDIATVYRYEEESDKLVYVQNRGFRSKGDPYIELELGQGYVGQVAETGEPVFVPEVDQTDDGQNYPFRFKQEGVVSYYGFPLISKGELQGVLELKHRSRLEPDGDWIHFAETLAGQAAIAVDNLTLFADLAQANKELREAYDATIEGWAHALEIRDKETEGHSRRVEKLTAELARAFGFSEKDLVHIRRGVLLHDIGKMGIPDQILHKPGPLDEAEWEVMKRHPQYAYDMLKSIDYLNPALNIPHYHHERWNGSGYPEGLKGEDIPLEARIFSVVDAWDALTSDRPYRKAWSDEKTAEYLSEQAGKEFDPEVVRIFLKMINLD